LLAQPHQQYSRDVRPLRHSIDVTLDRCRDHRAVFADDLHRHAVENLDQGRVKTMIYTQDLP